VAPSLYGWEPQTHIWTFLSNGPGGDSHYHWDSDVNPRGEIEDRSRFGGGHQSWVILRSGPADRRFMAK